MAEAPDDPELYELEQMLRKAHTEGNQLAGRSILALMDARQNPSWSQLPSNIIPDAANLAAGVVEMVKHPIDTAKGAAVGAYRLATDPDARAGALHEIDEAVGSPAALKRTIIKHPVSAALTVSPGVAGAVKYGPMAAKAAARATSAAGRELAKVPESTGITMLPSKKPLMTGPTSGVVPSDAPELTVMPSRAASVAEDKLYKAMIDAGWTPDRIAAKLRQLGEGATLADVDPFFGLGKTAAKTVKGERVARQSLGSRDIGREGRMLEAVDEALGPENYYKTQREMRERRTATAQPLRKEAMAENKVVKSDEIQRLLTRPKFLKGLKEGVELAKDEEARLGINIPKEDVWFSGMNFDDPDIVAVHTPTLRMLDAAKQGLDSQLEAHKDSFGRIQKNVQSTELLKMRNDVTDILRSHSKKYADYLDAWAEPSGELEALATGRKILGRDPEITVDRVKGLEQKDGSFKGGMPDEQKEALRAGLARDMVDDIISNPTSAVKHFKNRRTREIMQAVFPSKQAYTLFRKRMLVEARKHQTAQRASVGSDTARNVAAIAEAEVPESIAKDVAGGVMDIATGNKVGAIRRITNRLLRRKPEDTLTPVLDETSDVIYSQDPATQQRMITRFRNRYNNRGNTTSGRLTGEDFQ